MKLIVGLGNPGEKYKNNRHNVGYMVVDSLQSKFKFKDLVIKKTGVFMNESGGAVKRLIAQEPNSPITCLYIVHDDLDIPLGQFKIQKGKGPKMHNGLNSVEDALGTGDFLRVRIGVDNRDPENRMPGEEYVLQDFTDEEIEIVDRVISEVAQSLTSDI